MGLDMYAWVIEKKQASRLKGDVDVKMPEKGRTELHYWRKHHNLHGWMEQLYIKKGGKEEFNCATIRLTLEDLDQLEHDLKAGTLPMTTGFFFGNFPPNKNSLKNDMAFIEKARNAINDGKAVFYDSWW